MLYDVLLVTSVLNEMDKWPNIADTFKALGIKGDRGNACYCPVARYVKQVLPDVEYFSVSQSYFNVNHIDQPYVTPRRVSEFIYDFDMGYHPSLVDN